MAYSQDPSNDSAVQQLAGAGFPSGGPQLGQAEQFYLDEWDAAKSRGQGNPFAGWSLPGTDSGNDFFALVTLAEQFAANTGWQFFPTPTQLQWGVEHGVARQDQRQVFGWMSMLAGAAVQQGMPWAGYGMNQTQWQQNARNLDEISVQLTGNGWDTAGLDPNLKQQAIGNNWTTEEIQARLRADPNTMSRYGWIKHGMNFQAFQEYKTTNADELRMRYGNKFSDTQAVQNLDDPLTSLHGGGGAFQYQNQPSSRTDISGSQSEIR